MTTTETLPLSVLLTGQHPSRVQRSGRYTAESTAHPAKMLPAIARHLITTYTEPGDIVVDPMCGIGTTLVEAMYLGRNALGIEYESRWADLARANVALASDAGATGHADVLTGDARKLVNATPDMRGRVALVVTSPPYGPSTHGQVKAHGDLPVAKSDWKYSDGRDNLAYGGDAALRDGFRDILVGCLSILRPGGVVAITARPWRRHGLLVDLPTDVIELGEAAGLIPSERLAALLCGIDGDRLVPRASFFQLGHARRAAGGGIPLQVIAHEDVLILRAPS
jgi:modification methylase